MEVARRQYESLMGGLRAIGEERGWEIEQLVFVGGTCGAVRVESFNKNSSYWRYQKAGGIVYDSEWRSTRHGVKGVFCTEARTNDSVGTKKVALQDREAWRI